MSSRSDGFARVVVITDTRERQPYGFDPGRVTTVRRALRSGDYSLEGFEERVAVERKTLDDFAQSLIRARERFLAEMRRLESFDAACVVVEGSLRDLMEGKAATGAHPSSLLGAALSLIVDHGIPVFFCSDRQAACRFVEGYLLRVHRKMTGQWEPKPQQSAGK